MRGRCLTTIVGMALLGSGLVGCEPAPIPMEVHVTLHRGGLIAVPATGPRTVVLTGTSQCTRREPVDLFPTLTQGTVVARPGEVSVPCAPTAQGWVASFRVDDPIGAGSTLAVVEACTNPGDPIDEDCVTAGRTVTLGQVG